MSKLQKAISRVDRSKTDSRLYYDRISRYYDMLGGGFESIPANKALDYLAIRRGERVLEIGFGTGKCLSRIAGLAGEQGVTWGIDISREMILKTRKRIQKRPLLDRLGLCQGDASKLPFPEALFDVVFIAFTLELFDSPEIPVVLSEIERVLKPGGRLGVVCLSKNQERLLAVRFYEWMHSKWPKYIDCRPIYVAASIEQTGFRIQLCETQRLVILPVEVVIAVKDS
jgi:ubiquinone/menaquinone biosynthesis C-methylase UbiE